MEIGVFIPIGSNGWLISTTSPQYKPSFELNKQITLNAERYGFDFALSMIKLRGFGGKSEFWDHNLESFTLMAGLAAVTSRIKLYATVPTLAIPPAIAARMASTIDSISRRPVRPQRHHRLAAAGICPDGPVAGRRVLRPPLRLRRRVRPGPARAVGDRRLATSRASSSPWTTAGSARGRKADMKIICAGQSDAGMEFTAKYADYNFCFGMGFNTPTACADTVAAPAGHAPARPAARSRTYGLFMIITGETDAEAEAKWELYKDGADHEALALADPAGRGRHQVRRRHQRAPHGSIPKSAVNINIGLLLRLLCRRWRACWTRWRPFPAWPASC